ncbi:hypothetical protein TSOC_014136 [Tetrabaena socialis]|uniref:Uncharacterized protein n=1 Tax=Tetrabaena socialis TaxID=47790 RepID=A0A2J7ZIG6_9CHLO|nr:hypothetical protein TSOC_014136 [Tetrabaena socialis]|eukprot:PNH00059.1 hypothetical protein TSOC_014136 [Tetrabaena socialis]
MLALLGLALRRSCPVSSPGVDQDLRGAYRKLRSSLAAQLSDLLQHPGACGPHHQLLLGLTLRTHVLRCYSRLLGAAAQQLRGRRSRRNAQAAAEALTESAQLLIALAEAVSCSPGEAGAVELELRESELLEAWAMAYLQLASLEDRNNEELAAQLRKLVHFMFQADYWLKVDLLAGPAMSYLLTMAAVRLAASMDGGSVYGLPADAPELPNLPLASPLYGGLDAGAHRVVHMLALCGLHAWAGIDLSGRGNNASKLNLLAVFDVSLRIARGGVAAWLAPPEGTRQQLVARVGQLRMPRNGCGTTVCNALAVASAILRQASGPRPADTARLRALWAVHVAALEAALWPPEAVSDGGGGLGTARQLAPGWGVVVALKLPDVDWHSPSGGLLPAAPGPMADAMLEAGLVPCHEQLMRHTHTWPFYGCPVEWMEVLSYGPLPDLAALLVTAAKVVRRTRGACWGQQHERVDVLDRLFDVLFFCNWAAAGGGGGASGSAGGGGLEWVQPPTQLALLGSLVVLRLLPAVAQLLPGEVSCATSADTAEALCARLAEALQWCELLLAAYADAHERSTCGNAAAGCATAEAAEWRELLLRDVGLLGLLGAAARMLGDPSTVQVR